jgi:hypothetical protein
MPGKIRLAGLSFCNSLVNHDMWYFAEIISFKRSCRHPSSAAGEQMAQICLTPSPVEAPTASWGFTWNEVQHGKSGK